MGSFSMPIPEHQDMNIPNNILVISPEPQLSETCTTDSKYLEP